MATNQTNRLSRSRVQHFPAILVGALSLASACAFPADEGGEEIDSIEEPLTAVASAPDLAFHWAPRHVQDVNKS